MDIADKLYNYLQIFFSDKSWMRQTIWKSSFMLACLLFFVATQSYPTFEEYYVEYGRTYAVGGDQYNQRNLVYEQRIANFSQITDYVPGVNNLTDRFDYQITAMKGGKKSRPTAVSSSKKLKSSVSSGPSSFDWRDQDVITAVKDQGSCGSCWAFGAATAAQSYLILNKGYNNSVDLSQQFVLECTRGSSCDGGWPKDAVKMIVQYGITTEDQNPYRPYLSTFGICLLGSIKFQDGQQYTYYNLQDHQIIQLLQQSPLSITISTQRWQYYSSGILTCPPNSGISYPDHVVQLIGYTQDYWIIKNQWGRSWGMNGFAYITRSSNNNCLIQEELTFIKYHGGQLFSKVMIWVVALIFVIVGGI